LLCPVQRGVEDFLTEFAFRGIFYKICAPLLRVSSQAIFGPPASISKKQQRGRSPRKQTTTKQRKAIKQTELIANKQS